MRTIVRMIENEKLNMLKMLILEKEAKIEL